MKCDTWRFSFRLALYLGYPHPDYLLQDLTSSQLTDWMAYNFEEPFSPAETIITAILKGFSGGKKSSSHRVGGNNQQIMEDHKATIEGIFLAARNKGMEVKRIKRNDGNR